MTNNESEVNLNNNLMMRRAGFIWIFFLTKSVFPEKELYTCFYKWSLKFRFVGLICTLKSIFLKFRLYFHGCGNAVKRFGVTYFDVFRLKIYIQIVFQIRKLSTGLDWIFASAALNKLSPWYLQNLNSIPPLDRRERKLRDYFSSNLHCKLQNSSIAVGPCKNASSTYSKIDFISI